jgi:hypothetical protein
LTKIVASEKEKERFRVTNQVAHDIKSPLAALEVVMEDIKNLPEDSRVLVLHAINRIQNISNELSRKEVGPNLVAASCPISITLNSVVTEKRVEFQDRKNLYIELSDSTSHLNFVSMDESTICRIISNIINNSVEAVGNEDVAIKVNVFVLEKFVTIEISDNGPGLPTEILANKIERGFSVGKNSGQGLGHFYAMKELDKVNGSINLRNSNNGAIVSISIPINEKPLWFNESLDLSSVENIIIIDDDLSIHDLWKKKFSNLNISLHFFYKYDFNKLNKFKKDESSLLLIDYDLRDHVTGIEIILREKFSNSILVTSNYDMPDIISTCTQNYIPIIPNQLVQHVDFK